MFTRKITLMAIFLISLLAITAVGAADENATDNAMAVDNTAIATENTLKTTDSENLSTAHTVSGNTFADIQNAVNTARPVFGKW